VTLLNMSLIFFLYKGFLMVCFDDAFAQSIGIPSRALHYLMMLMLAVTIVISLKAVGVVLVSAMLVTPAATAFLLTNRLSTMLWLSALIGMVSGAGGAFLSYLGSHLPTGPLMVLTSGAIFLTAFLFAPRQGLVMRWWRHRDRASRIQQENTLKAMYHVMEELQFAGEGLSLEEFARYRSQTLDEARRELRILLKTKIITQDVKGQMLYFTPLSYQRACEIVRNHRLWELYLTNEVNYAPDHVHQDAEEIEHILGEEMVRKLERRLNHPRLDPHGKIIPGIEDIIRHQPMRAHSP
jgi:manganese/zinc/iron transport system permease protein